MSHDAALKKVEVVVGWLGHFVLLMISPLGRAMLPPEAWFWEAYEETSMRLFWFFLLAALALMVGMALLLLRTARSEPVHRE